MTRGFEKISFEQFCKDIDNNIEKYNEYNLPKRSTKNSAGYDFFAIEDFVIKPGEVKKIPTGVKAKMKNNEMLQIYVRSSMGFKYNVRLTNQVGIIDSDYYNNSSNEGHIWISLQNHGNDDYIVKKGDKFSQGIFVQFLLADDDDSSNLRTGGIGSTK